MKLQKIHKTSLGNLYEINNVRQEISGVRYEIKNEITEDRQEIEWKSL